MSSTLAIAPPAYEAPAIQWRGETAEREAVVWWVVLVGFSYAAALAWASYCIYSGGSPEISFTYKGFKMACHR